MSAKTISIQAQSLISDFISSLSQEGELHTKILREYKSDLKDFVFWFEKVWGKHSEDTLFHLIEVTARTIARYREHMQITRLLKPATINRRINSIKRYFDWAKQKELVQTDYSKSIKFVPTEKTSPKRMSDKEEVALEEYIASNNISQSYLFPSSKTKKRLQERSIRHILQKYMRLAKLAGF